MIRLIVCETEGNTCECCLGKRCVRSWSSYSLKQASSWKFYISLCLYTFHVFMCMIIIDMFRFGIPPPQTLLPPLLFVFSLLLFLLLCLPVKEVVVVGNQPWTFLWFSESGGHKIIKNREKPKISCQGILCFRLQLLDELTQRSLKQHSTIIFCVEHTIKLILFHDNICMK